MTESAGVLPPRTASSAEPGVHGPCSCALAGMPPKSSSSPVEGGRLGTILQAGRIKSPCVALSGWCRLSDLLQNLLDTPLVFCAPNSGVSVDIAR